MIDRTTISRLGIALLIGAAVSACARGKDSADGGRASRRVEVGAPAPAYQTVSLEGDSVSIAALRGKVVLLNVWATWCHPCRAEIPELRAIHEKYASRGLELVGVSVDADGSDERIREFMKEFQMGYPIWRDPDERVSALFLIFGVPATFLIDGEGVLRWRRTGPVPPSDSTLIVAIERALGS